MNKLKLLFPSGSTTMAPKGKASANEEAKDAGSREEYARRTGILCASVCAVTAFHPRAHDFFAAAMDLKEAVYRANGLTTLPELASSVEAALDAGAHAANVAATTDVIGGFRLAASELVALDRAELQRKRREALEGASRGGQTPRAGTSETHAEKAAAAAKAAEAAAAKIAALTKGIKGGPPGGNTTPKAGQRAFVNFKDGGGKYFAFKVRARRPTRVHATHGHARVYVRAHAHVHTYARVHAHVHAHVHMHMYMYMYTCMYVARARTSAPFAHAYAHVHAHAPARAQAGGNDVCPVKCNTKGHKKADVCNMSHADL